MGCDYIIRPARLLGEARSDGLSLFEHPVWTGPRALIHMVWCCSRKHIRLGHPMFRGLSCALQDAWFQHHLDTKIMPSKLSHLNIVLVVQADHIILQTGTCHHTEATFNRMPGCPCRQILQAACWTSADLLILYFFGMRFPASLVALSDLVMPCFVLHCLHAAVTDGLLLQTDSSSKWAAALPISNLKKDLQPYVILQHFGAHPSSALWRIVTFRSGCDLQECVQAAAAEQRR